MAISLGIYPIFRQTHLGVGLFFENAKHRKHTARCSVIYVPSKDHVLVVSDFPRTQHHTLEMPDINFLDKNHMYGLGDLLWSLFNYKIVMFNHSKKWKNRPTNSRPKKVWNWTTKLIMFGLHNPKKESRFFRIQKEPKRKTLTSHTMCNPILVRTVPWPHSLGMTTGRCLSFGDTRCPRPTRKIMHQYVHSDLLCLCVYIIINVYVYMYVYIYIIIVYHYIYIYVCIYIYIHICDTNMDAPSVSPWNYTSDRNHQWLTCASPSPGLAPAGLTTPKLSKMACCWKIPHVSLRFTPL